MVQAVAETEDSSTVAGLPDLQRQGAVTEDERQVLERIYRATRDPYPGIASDIRSELAWLLGVQAEDHAVAVSREWAVKK